MGEWQLVKLKFGRSPVHFGELGIGIEESQERVRSDTLFSAWVSNYARLFGKGAVEELLNKFQKSKPPMRISSTFIYREVDDKTVFYLPRPLKFPIKYPDDDLKFFKTYKSLNYLPLETWERWYQGEGFTNADAEELENKIKGDTKGKLNQAGVFDYKKAFKYHKLPKVAIDRTTRATNFYHTGYVQFDWEGNGNAIKSLSGLYFLVYFEDINPAATDLIANLKAALDLLGEEGIGGERSSGAGLFEAEWLDLLDVKNIDSTWKRIIQANNTNSQCLISLFWDNDKSTLEELIINNSSSCYEIQERGGWLTGGNTRRQMVRMFLEGSVFPIKPQGKLANVTPKEFKEHEIYRSGIALTLPIKTKI